MLRFSNANTKITTLSKIKELSKFLKDKRKVYSFDLLSGWSCPGAHECLSKVRIKNGKKFISDGPNTKFRCFSASQEVAYPSTYNLRSGNYEQIKNTSSGGNSVNILVNDLHTYMPENLGICRIHVAGDFLNIKYFEAWLRVAQNNSDRLFYAYTKSLSYWQYFRKEIEKTNNFILTASYGGRYDHLIKPLKFRYSKVIFHPKEAGKLKIDHDDSNAARPSLRNKNFCLLLHGTQPAKSEASKALQILRKENIKHSYTRK